MKTSKFLNNVLKRFHNGKSFTRTPTKKTFACSNPNSDDYFKKVPCTKKGRNNLAGMVEHVAEVLEVKPTKAKLAITNALGHVNYDGFASSKSVKFPAVKAVLEAAIKHARAKGD